GIRYATVTGVQTCALPILILNDFVRLETVLDLLEPGASGQLVIDCRSSLPLVPDEQAAFALVSDAPIVEVQLSVELRRDDAQLEIGRASCRERGGEMGVGR